MKNLLVEIGLTPNESCIYAHLTDVQSATVSQISKLTKIHRTTVYEFLKKGLTFPKV